jgi:hypothetical protein
MYFVDRQQKTRWPYDLHAENDAHALALAHATQDACSDVQIGIELWQGARRIAGTSNRRPETIRIHWEELPIDKQSRCFRSKKHFSIAEPRWREAAGCRSA